ncbi:MAG: 50S ribosomal protein L13 [Oscillospiraceae bacterium]
MSISMASASTIANAKTISRKWYILDAAGVPVGRLAVKAANILRGKVKPIFTPNVDCGDYVIIINAAKAVMTGKKASNKKYYHHTGYIGSMKEITYEQMMEKFPTRAMTKAVKGMVPDTTLGRMQLTRLRVYADANYENAAQKPEIYSL